MTCGLYQTQSWFQTGFVTAVFVLKTDVNTIKLNEMLILFQMFCVSVKVICVCVWSYTWYAIAITYRVVKVNEITVTKFEWYQAALRISSFKFKK